MKDKLIQELLEYYDELKEELNNLEEKLKKSLKNVSGDKFWSEIKLYIDKSDENFEARKETALAICFANKLLNNDEIE